jgi:outer membrane protein assembly factor BamA
VAIDQPRGSSQDRRLPLCELRSLVSTRAGERVDPSKLEADRRALGDALVARGYLAAKVTPATVTYGASGAYVVFDVERGPMFHVRSIEITGPGERDADVLTLSVGDDADRARIERARQALAEVLASRSTRSRVELHTRVDLAAATLDLELATTEVVVERAGDRKRSP